MGYTLRGIVDTRRRRVEEVAGGFSDVGASRLLDVKSPEKRGKHGTGPVNFIFDHLFCPFFNYSSALYFLIMSSSPGRKLEAEDVSLLLCIATIL
jgi:hypothetical protein